MTAGISSHDEEKPTCAGPPGYSGGTVTDFHRSSVCMTPYDKLNVYPVTGYCPSSTRNRQRASRGKNSDVKGSEKHLEGGVKMRFAHQGLKKSIHSKRTLKKRSPRFQIVGTTVFTRSFTLFEHLGVPAVSGHTNRLPKFYDSPKRDSSLAAPCSFTTPFGLYFKMLKLLLPTFRPQIHECVKT